VSERPHERAPGDGEPEPDRARAPQVVSDTVDDAAAQRRGVAAAPATTQPDDRAPSALSDPASAIHGSA
jgi:hypothetical protein